MKQRHNLTVSLMGLSTIPVMVFCVIVLLASSFILYNSSEQEIKYSLELLCRGALQQYEIMFPGSYEMTGAGLVKGDHRLEGQFSIVDDIKEFSGADITLFYGKSRYLTTIENPDGSRAVGTKAEEEVTKQVLSQGENFFSSQVSVNGIPYFGYYTPIRDGEGTPMGMFFSGKPRSEVMKTINRNLMMIFLIAMAVCVVTIGVTIHYSKNIVSSIHKTEEFLRKMAGGDPTTEIDPHLLERRDELGDMGRFAVMLQKSITDLVGKDPLTGLYNRRSCDLTIQNAELEKEKKGTAFTIVMGDIDHFKQVNDSYGHQAGDEVLKRLAEIFCRHMEHLGFVFRWGGEEFLFVYEHMEKEEARKHLEVLRKDIMEMDFSCDGEQIKITMTFGMTDHREDCKAEGLMQIADQNLYRGKRQGRNCIVMTEQSEPSDGLKSVPEGCGDECP